MTAVLSSASRSETGSSRPRSASWPSSIDPLEYGEKGPKSPLPAREVNADGNREPILRRDKSLRTNVNEMAAELKKIMSKGSDQDEQPKRSGQRLQACVAWLVAGPAAPPPDVQRELLIQSLTKTKTLVASVVVVSLTASIVVAMTAAPWAYAWVLAVIFTGGIRIWLMNALLKAYAAGADGKITAPILAGLAYFGVTSAGCYQCVASGQWDLVSIAGFGLASLIGAVSSHHAGTPRLALLLVCLLAAPFSLGCLISPVPHLFILGIQLPVFAAAVIFGMFQSYVVLINLHQSERENRRLAQRDVLTGLPNRALNLKHFDQLLAGLRSDHGMLRQEFMVFCLDLDGFKDINDSFGHAAGDAVLVAVAQRLRDSVRAVDFVSRIGGDEFVILLPAITPEAAADIAARIIACVSSPFDIGLPAPVRVGVSIGSACAPGDGETTDELLRSADRALYEAKRLGKGIFVAHDALKVALAPMADAGMAGLERREKGTHPLSPLPFPSKSV